MAGLSLLLRRGRVHEDAVVIVLFLRGVMRGVVVPYYLLDEC